MQLFNWTSDQIRHFIANSNNVYKQNLVEGMIIIIIVTNDLQ